MSGICQRDYWTFSTTASKKDEKSDGNEQRTVSGEMIKRQMPQEPIMIYVGVGSVTEYFNKVERLGGKVINKGQRFQATDGLQYAKTENNGFALWESKHYYQININTTLNPRYLCSICFLTIGCELL